MSTAAIKQESRAGADARPSTWRLTLVELRKMVDTRSGIWVLFGVTAITVLVAVISALNHGGIDGTYVHVFHAASQPSAYLLPVIGILLICGEWTQRTTLTTFTLVSSRPRVIVAKTLGSLVVSLAALIVTLLVSIVCAALFGNALAGAGSMPLVVILQGWFHMSAWMLIGVAFGMAMLTSAPAIVTYLLVPVLFATIVGAFNSLTTLDHWIDPTQSFIPLTLHALSATAWARIGVTLALWVGVPLAIGLRRILRGDID